MQPDWNNLEINEECLYATKEEWLECAKQVLQINDIQEW